MNNKKMSTGKKVVIGAGVGAGLAALSAGAYYFLGPKGKAHQKKAKALVAKYKPEIAKLANKLDSEWKSVSKTVSKNVKKVKKAVRK